MWTAPLKTAYLAIVSHFVDLDTQESATALISLRELKGTHGGEAMGQVFLEVIEEYGLKNKIGFFTMDNAGSNDTMLQYIASQIPDFDPIIRRVWCNGHILNLAAQAFLFGPKGKKGRQDKDEFEAIDEAIRQVSALSKSEQDGQKDKEKLVEE